LGSIREGGVMPLRRAPSVAVCVLPRRTSLRQMHIPAREWLFLANAIERETRDYSRRISPNKAPSLQCHASSNGSVCSRCEQKNAIL
jgi:hypothetical protein